MNYIGKFISNFRDFYNEINSATLTGAIDVIVIQQPDGTYQCSPFHVRFGKIGVLRSREKVVDIEVNGHPVDIHMKLGESGEAFFVEEVPDEHEIPLHLATSPLPAVPDIGEELRKLKLNEIVTVSSHKECISSEISNIVEVSPSHPSANSVSYPSESCAVAKDVLHEARSESSSQKIFVDEHGNCEMRETVDKADILVQSNEKVLTITFEEVTVSGITHIDPDDNYKAKRRKRKKISGKRRTKSREVNIPSSLVSDKRERTPVEEVINSSGQKDTDEDNTDNHEDIFQMDNDYVESDEDEGYPCISHGLSRSVSLPVNCNKCLPGEWTTRKMSSTFTGEFHPFSDGDVTPHNSPTGSRPPSPKSDTEYENQKLDHARHESNQPSWVWGELPNVPKKASSSQLNCEEQSGLASNTDDANKTVDTDDADKRSMLGGMLNFMRSTKKYRHMPESEGIYLDSINANALDPEVAALYFPKFRSAGVPSNGGRTTPSVKDEDAESGKGPSLPHSPHSVEGAIGGPSSQDSDNDERQFIFGCYNDVAMSLCGGLLDVEAEFPEERFNNSVVTYDAFTENPSILLNPSLVVRVGGKYYNWQTAAPMLVSMTVFQRLLPEKTTNLLINEHMPKKKKSKSYSSWWSWRRSETETKPETPLEEVNTPTEIMSENETKSDAELQKVICDARESWLLQTEYTEHESADKSDLLPCDSNSVKSDDDCDPTKSVQLEMENKKNDLAVTFTQASSSASSECNSPAHAINSTAEEKMDELSVPASSDADLQSNSAKDIDDYQGKRHPKDKYKKSLRLTSDQISSLNLQQGPNEVVFSVTTAYQGTTRCRCDIYLWNYDDKIVISDIDGTITKSDVLGHILPMVGKDWAQLGVAKLFTKVKDNGYQFLYLSARAIGQARITRDYLHSIRQGEVCLPDGPLLLSPTSLISALHREVIERKPEEFKISCLKDIQTLYPSFMGNPFYAGFGNKINDTWAYRAVGIPITRIFTINHRGELKLELIQTFQSSYVGLSDRVDHIFPSLDVSRKINGRLAPSFTSSEEFSYFTYWREPISSISDDELPE